ncbi:hypothetical protein OG21DRAFT_1517737 [Imleria badia]|nr:hypothetical protein OG21DRAFT_1517737 [Imleria badia]
MESFTLLRLHDTVGVSSTNGLIEEVTTFISHVVPPMLCYFVMAVLAITPQTRTIRLALFPAMVLLALRAAFPMDMSLKITERTLHQVYLQIWMFVTTTRALGWAMARKPLVRQLRPVSCSTPSTLMDALDLLSNIRGYGWDWSCGVHIPCETRPSNRTGFIFYTILSAAAHAFVFGILNTAIRSFSPASFGTLSGFILDDTRPFLHRAIGVCFPVGHGNFSGGSIFDESLPFYLRFLRSSLISTLALVWNYVGLQALYDLCTILGVLILGQDPAQWPPLFDAPWLATSLTDFWGRRWHQLLRHTLLVLGGYPLSSILGRAGIVIGAFLASAVFHHVELTALNNNSEFWRMVVGFGMMAPGIIIEDAFKDVTGRNVRGLSRWVWTGWILLWGNVIVDGFMRAGMFRFPTLIDFAPPVRMLVEYLVTEFDNWLHAIPSVLVAWNITVA